LCRAGMLDGEARAAALVMIRGRRKWWGLVSRILLFTGCLLVLAGITSFLILHENLELMGGSILLGLGICACIVFTVIAGRRSITGKALLMCGAFLIGILLYLHFQKETRQHDAVHTYLLAWLVLSLGFIIPSEFAALWLVWLAVGDVLLINYYDFLERHGSHDLYEFLLLAIAIFNSVGLYVREALLSKGWEWLRGRWLREVLMMAVLLPLTISAIIFIATTSENFRSTGVPGFVIWLAAVTILYKTYRFRFPDMTSLGILAISICSVLLSIVIVVLIKLGLSTDLMALITTIAAIAFFGLAINILRRFASTMREGQDD
jgi:hypothetical protein